MIEPMNRMPRALSAAALAACLGACATNPVEKILRSDPGTGLYERSRHPDKDDRAAVLFRAAYDRRDPAALRETFADALALCEADEFDASESVGVAWQLQLYLARFGDERFAAVLAGESPRTQSAVDYHLTSGVKWSVEDRGGLAKLYPRTERILRDAPEVNWPVDKAIAAMMAN